MSNRERVLAQLDKSMAAHRTAHHATLRAAREHRARLAAEVDQFSTGPEAIAEPEPAGMSAGLPPQDASSLYDLNAPE